MSKTSISANRLNNTPLPSITGFPAIGPNFQVRVLQCRWKQRRPSFLSRCIRKPNRDDPQFQGTGRQRRAYKRAKVHAVVHGLVGITSIFPFLPPEWYASASSRVSFIEHFYPLLIVIIKYNILIGIITFSKLEKKLMRYNADSEWFWNDWAFGDADLKISQSIVLPVIGKSFMVSMRRVECSPPIFRSSQSTCGLQPI